MRFFCVLFYLPWIVTRTLPISSFHSKSFYVLHDNHLSSNVFMILFWCGCLDNIFFPSQLDLSIDRHSYWSRPMILVDTISRDITRVKRTSNNLHWVSYISRNLISRMYFLWTVMTKKYFLWTSFFHKLKNDSFSNRIARNL
jgi:hypothetical protein